MYFLYFYVGIRKNDNDNKNEKKTSENIKEEENNNFANEFFILFVKLFFFALFSFRARRIEGEKLVKKMDKERQKQKTSFHAYKVCTCINSR